MKIAILNLGSLVATVLMTLSAGAISKPASFLKISECKQLVGECVFELPGNRVSLVEAEGELRPHGFLLKSQLPIVALVTFGNPIRIDNVNTQGITKIFVSASPVRNGATYFTQLPEGILEIDGTRFNEGSLLGLWVESTSNSAE